MNHLQVIVYTVVYIAAIIVGLMDLLVWRP
jgi:hypothetical protein